MTDTNWPEIYFIRHGQTQWNAEQRYQGQRDIPLNDFGRAQADANGPLLRELLDRDNRDPKSFQWHASPLGRAVETMERVRAAFNNELPAYVTDDLLKEISFGVLEGKLFNELVGETVHAPGDRGPEYWTFRPDTGESYEDLVVRLNRFRGKLTGPAIVVAHGGIARAFRFLIEGAPIEEIVNWRPPQDAVLHFTNGLMAAYSTGLGSEGPQA